MEKSSPSGNQLQKAKSLYLLQHRENPVHWWPYGPDPIRVAREKNWPIFLSIGYSSCHWCHVMARESFQDKASADFLNHHFVCVKVDREEHPDLDQYYQRACVFFGRQGGWPLSAFLLPDLRPFFVGTYFPRHSRRGEMTFLELLKELTRACQNEHSQVEKAASAVAERLKNPLPGFQSAHFSRDFPEPEALLRAVFSVEEKKGGGKAPRFPHFPFYEFALEQTLQGLVGEESRHRIFSSLEEMLLGGMTDHVRGGVHRYSTDEKFFDPPL